MTSMDPRDARLRSQYYAPGQLIALGRVAELSALLEVLLRQVLSQVMGLSQTAGEALFLGDRASTLVARIRELGKFEDMPRWFSEEAVDWAKRVSKAIDQRDALLHRAPVVLHSGDEDDDRVLRWSRARRAHEAMPVDDVQLMNLVELLVGLEGEGIHKLFWGEWETSVRDPRLDGANEAGAEGTA